MLIYNVGFKNSLRELDETQIDIAERNSVVDEQIEMFNLILSLKEELDIQEIVYIDYVGEELEEDLDDEHETEE